MIKHKEPPPPVIFPIRKAIHLFCKECNGCLTVWEECVSTRCSLFAYRPGNSQVGRPTKNKRIMGAVQREEVGKRLQAAREKKATARSVAQENLYLGK